MKWINWQACSLAAVVLIFIQSAGDFGLLPTSLFPTPKMLMDSFLEEPSVYLEAFGSTLMHSLLGFMLSAILGLLSAMILFNSRFFVRAVFPFAIFFQTVPIVAIAPLLVIYFGFGHWTLLSSSVFVSYFPVLASVLLGLESVDIDRLRLFSFLGATRTKALLFLRLPSAYPFLLSGLRISSGLSVIGVVAGEFVAGGGLGALIDSARTQQRVDIVFLCLVFLALIGLFMLASIKMVDWIICRWRPLRSHG